MDYRYIPGLPVPIVDAALEVAKKRFNVDLDRNILTELYWQIRWRRDALIRLRRNSPRVKVSTGFEAARAWVLDQRFPQRRPQDQFMRKAYSSALGRIGYEFRKRAQPAFQLGRTELERIMDLVTLEKDRRQYRLIV